MAIKILGVLLVLLYIAFLLLLAMIVSGFTHAHTIFINKDLIRTR